MKVPKIIESDKFLNSISWFMKVGGITIFPFIVIRENLSNKERFKIINHETIHIKQQKEMLIIPFYVFYLLEWFVRIFQYGIKDAYTNISFEKEAYSNEINYWYAKKDRKIFSWIKYLKK